MRLRALSGLTRVILGIGRFFECLAFMARHGRLVRELGLFDDRFYSRQAATSWARRAPLLHYLLVGWRSRVPTSAKVDQGFVDETYYPSMADYDAMSPIEAHVRVGRFHGLSYLGGAGRRDTDEAAPRWIAWGVRTRVAVVVHAFYDEEFGLILERLRVLRRPFDLIVTTSRPEEMARLAAACGIRIDLLVPVPNLGRDVFPFVALVNNGLLDRYEYVAKVHTKRSTHRRDGRRWFESSIDALLSPSAYDGAMGRFEAEPDLGMLAPPGAVAGRIHLVANRWRIEALALRAGYRFDPDTLRFAAGSAFWARSAALRAIERTGLAAAEFETESGQLDGTVAHAVERLFGAGCLADGYRIEELSR